MSVKGKRHLQRVADLGCILCRHLGYGQTPAEVHHLKEECGAGQRQSDFIVAPLCPEHHRGASGIHGLGRKAFERTYRMTELDLLAMTLEALA